MEHPEKQSIIWSKTEAQIEIGRIQHKEYPHSVWKMRKVLRKVMDFDIDRKN